MPRNSRFPWFRKDPLIGGQVAGYTLNRELGAAPIAGNPTRSKVYVDELKGLKEVFSEHPALKWAIYFAGFGGLMEGLRVLWDIGKFFWSLKH